MDGHHPRHQDLEASGRPAGPSPLLSIVLPSHNEVSLLGSTVANLVGGLIDRKLSYEIVIVENGSRDGTLRLARVLAAQMDGVRTLVLARGDYGAALAAGFESARGEIVVNFDVDYYDFAFLDAALSRLRPGGVDLVLGSKRAPGAHDRRPLARRILTAAFSGALRSLVGLEVSDAHGMKALDRAALAPIVEACQLRGSLFDVEMVVRAGRQGLAVEEVPATVVERRPPRTSVLLRTGESLLGMVRLRRLLAREEPRRPRRG